VLGPLLFISFIDDVSGVIHFCRFHIYADDLQIYHSSSVADLQRCYNEVNADLKRIYDWAGSYGLKLNPEKRQVILIQRGRGGDVPQSKLFIGSDYRGFAKGKKFGICSEQKLDARGSL
jgi:hypothetical protein